MITKQHIEKYITDPGQLSLSTIPELEKLLEAFPYFQTAQLLYVKNLHKEHNIHYNHQLRVAAAYAGDRAILKHLIDTSAAEQAWEPEPAEEPQTAAGENSAAAESKGEASETARPAEYPAKDPAKEMPLDHEEVEKDSVDEKAPDKEQSFFNDEEPGQPGAKSEAEPPVSDVGYPYRESELADDEQAAGTSANRRKRELEKLKLELNELKKERQTIEEVIRQEEQRKKNQQRKKEALRHDVEEEEGDSGGKAEKKAPEKYHGAEPQKRKPEKEPGNRRSERRKKSKQELIEKFIQEEPSIKRSAGIFYDPTEVARRSIMQSDDIATETLAKLYLKQGKVLQAIKIYEKLSLKFPQKSDYFANQIKELKKTNK